MFFRLEDVKEYLNGEWICFVAGQKINVNSEEELNTYRNYMVVSINARDNCIALELKPWEFPITKDCIDEDWYKEHMKQFGTAPDFF